MSTQTIAEVAKKWAPKGVLKADLLRDIEIRERSVRPDHRLYSKLE